MAGRNYWLDLFTGKTWQEFLEAGATVSGFREARWKTVEQMRPGDYLLCYLTGLSRWIGVLEVTSAAFQDSATIWEDAAFPCRVRVRPVVTLTPETAVPILDLRDQLSVFQNLSNPFAWTGHFRGSPARMKVGDGEVIVNALQETERNPVRRRVDVAKLNRKPHVLRASKLGDVTVPEREEGLDEQIEPTPTVQLEDVPKEPTLHIEPTLRKSAWCDFGLSARIRK